MSQSFLPLLERERERENERKRQRAEKDLLEQSMFNSSRRKFNTQEEKGEIRYKLNAVYEM